MLVSILIPAYARPEQLAEALESVALQDRALIGEIIVSDDSPAAFWPQNQDVIAASALAPLIRYVCNEPARGCYPNQWFLASQARHDRLLFLHNDDWLCPGGLGLLLQACRYEVDSRVKVWFGRNHIGNEDGTLDAARTALNDQAYGKEGPSAVRPLWEWCLTHALPPDCFLIDRATYLRHMQGPRDGNVGDWALWVRLANEGLWARFVAEYVSVYRVQAGSITTAGRGMDVHLYYEMAKQLRVPPEAADRKHERFAAWAPVATLRYARAGERARGWACFLSGDWSLRKRLSPRGLATAFALSMPRALWEWALTYRDEAPRAPATPPAPPTARGKGEAS